MDSFILNAALFLLGLGFVSIVVVILFTINRKAKLEPEKQSTLLQAGERISEDNILNLVKVSSYLRVVKLLVGSPKTVSEFVNLTNFTEKEIAEMLIQLQVAGAVVYSGKFVARRMVQNLFDDMGLYADIFGHAC